MDFASIFQFWTGTTAGVAPGTGKAGVSALSPLRLPSTKISTAKPVSPALTIVSSLATPDQAVLKRERRDFAFKAGVKVIPHPDKVAKGGEDAYFISSYNGGVLGVADGVSGWAEENVDPALFSKELMAHALAAVESEEADNDPKRVIAKAHSSTLSIGAATAIVAILEKRGVLHVANVGDCGLRIVRQGKVVYATAPQQHYFDCPYQLSSENAQTADDAAVYELSVLEGDVIVMGSDGLFDNVYDYEIESIIRAFNGSDEDFSSQAAGALASLACKHAMDRKFDSPYAMEAIRQGNDLPWWAKVIGRKIGGKVDDITVVVGHIVGTPVSADDDGVAAKEDKADSVASEEVSTDESKLQTFREEQISKVEAVSTVDTVEHVSR
jgi:protein phosphatase PTC7